jgi:hypothetical protein
MADDRSANLANKAQFRERLRRLYNDVEKGFENAHDRAVTIEDNWDIYNCKLSANQLYNGRNELFMPIVYGALQARSTRFVNQLFPITDRHIECTSEDGTLPRAAMAVAEHYIRQVKLRELMPALVVSGDVEGQYNVYISWRESRRVTLRRANVPVSVEGAEVGKSQDILEEEEVIGCPSVEIVPDIDVCILPITSDGVDDALSRGGAVAIVRRWSKKQVRQLIEDGEVDKAAAESLLDEMDEIEHGLHKDTEKELACAAGIKKDGRGVWALVYEIWTEMDIGEDQPRLCQIYMASKYRTLTLRRNPLWCDRCPLLSASIEKLPGVAKGIAPVSQVAKLAYYANDILNETADSANYSLLPIIFRDPTMNTAPLTLAPAAVWDVSPADIKFAEFPPLYREGLELLNSIKLEIFQILSVSPASITQAAGTRKLNQAEVAQEQQVDLLSTADAVSVIESGILSPMVGLFMDLDYQFRDADLTVRQFGEMGMQANLERVPPFHSGARYAFRWVGVEASRSQQQMQQKIAALNIIKAIPPQAYPGYTLDLQPVIVDIVESVYGAQLGRQVLKDIRSQISIDPTKENQLMDMGHYVPVHPLDDHRSHVSVHGQSIQVDGDTFGSKAVHVQEHVIAMAAMAQQQQAAMAGPLQQQQGGLPGPPGGPAQIMQGPGARPGAQPDQGRPAQGPPGMIPPDQLHDPTMMPRRAG